ncbi:hypothetical protein BDN70DRAFT_830877 [Pholiota conissans]|uniref:Flavin reductase like domain-containing protein n=1 Tax=Pholiota conissans TaxID=109636 RepID=A0A9P5Z5T7_9AGAR|nr:hypothetical protein BDN70DRAFT_830877 [Pholiota conissans]
MNPTLLQASSAFCFRPYTVTGARHGLARFNSSTTSSRPGFNLHSTFTYVKPPAAEWRLGDGVSREMTEWNKDHCSANRKTWDLSTANPEDTRNSYRLLTSAIIPRPIAFISTLSETGQPNLAPFSYFSMVSHNPPLVSVSFSLSTRRPKDTRNNIIATKEFTISIVTEAIAEAANSASVESPADTDEWIISGLSKETSSAVRPPFVRESPIGMECELYSFQDIKIPDASEPTTTVILGLIKRIHVRETFLNDDGVTIDPAKLRPIARLGGTTYARVLEGFDLPRVSWKAIKDKYPKLLKTKDS